jgi:hypothetical protein
MVGEDVFEDWILPIKKEGDPDPLVEQATVCRLEFTSF